MYHLTRDKRSKPDKERKWTPSGEKQTQSEQNEKALEEEQPPKKEDKRKKEKRKRPSWV
jgi:hypothetical protein